MLKAGDRFGDYAVVRLLGQGGMGSVFLLENAEGAQVAAKILDPESAGDAESRKRFLREAELALGVKHPNLVETYDVGEDPDTGLCYILMEYVPGGSLADRLKTGPLSVNDAIRIVYQIAAVLELARQKGIVHRDIKPGNILFGADGKAKLADLGIARGGIAGTETTTVTQTGMMIGTPAYMAPEQMLDAHHVDTRADIYSLGVVFFEMLTGERPNKDDTVVQLMARAVKGEPLPDVRTLRPEVSASVAELISLMCAMKADERVQTPTEVTTAISQIVHGREVTVIQKRPGAVAKRPAAKGRRRNSFPWKALIPIGFLAGLAAAFILLAPKKEAPKQQEPPSVKAEVQTVVRTNVIEKVVEKPADKPVQDAVEKILVVTNTVFRREEQPAYASNPNALDDETIRETRIGGVAWRYCLEKGEAVITSGKGGWSKDAVPAISPKPSGRLVVPAELDGYKVVAVGNRALMDCRELESVEIPEGVRELRGWGTFYCCRKLKSVVLPNSLRLITGWSVFMCCDSLEELDVRMCEHFDGQSVVSCPNLVRFACAKDNPGLCVVDGVLYDRSRTTLVRYPCGRSDMVIPGGVGKLAWSAFQDCAMDRITVPEGVQSIGPFAFSNCRKAVEASLPFSLIDMGWNVFNNCESLRRVFFAGNSPSLQRPQWALWSRVPKHMRIFVSRGTQGWNGAGSTDLPESWPPGGDPKEARPILYADQSDGSTSEAANPMIAVEAPVAFAKEKAKLEEMLGKIVPALNGLMGGTLKTAGRRIVVSDKCRGYSVSRDGNTLTLSPGMSGFPQQTMGVGERVAVFLSGLGRKESAHTEVCANAMDWYLSFRLREVLGSCFDGSEKFKGDLSKVGSGARKLDPEMSLYDLRGESQNRKARKLVGSEKSTFAKEKCFWLFEQMRARNDDVIAGFLKAWEREQAAGNLADPVSQDDVAALFSVAVGEDLFDWFSEHGMPSSPERTRVKAKFTGASTPAGWLDDLEIAKARAKASGKMILAAFEGSDWCGWCKKMEKDVYTQPDFMPRVTPRFVPVYIDSPRDRDLLSEKCRERNPELHREYNVRGVPCVVILDAEGKEIGRVGGYKQNVDALMERVDALIGRAQDPSARVCTDEKRKWKTDGKTSTPTGMTDDFEAACVRAKKEKKKILLVFSGSDWCGFCKRLDDDVLSEKKFIRQVSRKYVPVYVDSPRDRSLLSAKAQDRNPGLIDRYSPNGYPTVVVTDADGEELARFSGYGGGGSSAFMRRLEDAVKESEKERKRRK